MRKGWETAKNRTSHHQPERLPDFHCLRRLANARGPNYPPDKVRREYLYGGGALERPMHLFGQEVCARCWSIFLAPCKKHCDNCGHCDNRTGIGFARTQSPADR